MKITRIIATLLILSPVAGLAGVVVFMRASLLLMEDRGVLTEPSAVRLAIALFLIVFSRLAFTLGVALHWFTARRSGIHRRETWRLMFGMSILLCIQGGAGLVLGGSVVALLFVLKTFRRMKNGEPMDGPLSSESAPCASPDEGSS